MPHYLWPKNIILLFSYIYHKVNSTKQCRIRQFSDRHTSNVSAGNIYTSVHLCFTHILQAQKLGSKCKLFYIYFIGPGWLGPALGWGRFTGPGQPKNGPAQQPDGPGLGRWHHYCRQRWDKWVCFFNTITYLFIYWLKLFIGWRMDGLNHNV